MNAKLAEFELRINDGEPADIQSEPEDTLAKFIERAALAGEIGWRHVARFEEETSHINTHADEAIRKRHSASDFDETLIPDSQVLAKAESPGDRRRHNCRTWLCSQLALGKSAPSLIEHAQRHDPGVATLLRELSKELGA